MKKIVLIGCGGHSRKNHGESLRSFCRKHPGRIQLAACCDLDRELAEKTAREYGFGAAFTDIETMLNAVRPDGCVSVMPIPAIFPVGKLLLEAHVPCVIEKPLGSGLEEIQQLAEIAEDTKTPHMVSVDRRFNPYINDAISWIKARGPVHSVKAAMLRVNRVEPEFIWGTGIHMVDAVAALGGGIKNAHGEVVKHETMRSPWYRIELTLRNGMDATIHIEPTCGVNDEYYHFGGEGTYATAAAYPWAGNMEVMGYVDGALVHRKTSPEGEPSWVRCGAYEETAAFIDALETDFSRVPALADVMPALQFCFQLYEKSI